MVEFTQCLIVKGTTRQYSWIPTQLSKVGRVLMFKKENGKWNNGWIIIETYKTIEEEKIYEWRKPNWRS